MKVLVDGYPHRTGEHCASTAISNVLRFHGVEMSEGMVLGLSSGLGFFYIRSDALSPSRMFHGRTASLEQDFCANTGLAHENRVGLADDLAWADLRRQIDSGRPALISTDTFYLGYHNTTSHFPGHRVVVVGYDDEADQVFMADRKFEDYQVCSRDELRRSRNADDYPASCQNELIEFTGDVAFGRPLAEGIRTAALQNSREMLEPLHTELSRDSAMRDSAMSAAIVGIPGMRALAEDLPRWKELEDWSWSARFGYQVVVKRGSGGSFFRSMYADFLREAAGSLPALQAAGLPQRMSDIAARWCELAALLKDQSERDRCDPALFEQAGDVASELADREECFFEDLARTLG